VWHSITRKITTVVRNNYWGISRWLVLWVFLLLTYFMGKSNWQITKFGLFFGAFMLMIVTLLFLFKYLPHRD